MPKCLRQQLFCTWDIAASQQALTMRIMTLVSKAMAAVDRIVRIGIAVRLKMKAKHRKFMKTAHPDVGGSTEDAKRINYYYDVLKQYAA